MTLLTSAPIPFIRTQSYGYISLSRRLANVVELWVQEEFDVSLINNYAVLATRSLGGSEIMVYKRICRLCSPITAT